MTGKKFAQWVRKQTKTNSETYTDEELLLDMNIMKDEIVSAIAQINEDVFGMLAYRNLVAGQREYSIPEFTLDNIKYFEVDIKGTSKHVRAEETDLVKYGGSTDERSIQFNFQNRKPGFEIFRQSLWLYSGDPIIDVIDGLKLYYIRYPNDIPLARLSDDLTDLSNDLVFPISAGYPRQIHKVWATKVIVAYKNSKEKPITLTQAEQNVEKDLATAVQQISGINLDRDAKATVPTYAFGQNY